MNTLSNIGRRWINSTIVVALASLALLTGNSLAQEKGAGAAHMKKLVRLDTPADVQKVEAGDMVVMSCPKCKDTWVSVVQSPAKGGRQVSATVQQHACPGCDTKIVTEGAGKQAKTTLKHVCKQCGSEDAYCCVIKKGGAATKGMEGKKANRQ